MFKCRWAIVQNVWIMIRGWCCVVVEHMVFAMQLTAAIFCPSRKEIAMAGVMVVICPLGFESEMETDKALNLEENQ